MPRRMLCESSSRVLPRGKMHPATTENASSDVVGTARKVASPYDDVSESMLDEFLRVEPPVGEVKERRARPQRQVEFCRVDL